MAMLDLPEPDQALPGRSTPMAVVNAHHVHGRPIAGDFPGLARVQFGMGCFWGAERKFWSLPGVYTTAVGYAGGYTPNPTYREVCSGRTGHAEVVLVVFDRAKLGLDAPTSSWRNSKRRSRSERKRAVAEDEHQQYLSKNPRGYCGLGGTGVACAL